MKGSERGEGRLGARGWSASENRRTGCNVGVSYGAAQGKMWHRWSAPEDLHSSSSCASSSISCIRLIRARDVKRSAALEKINGDCSGATAAATLDCTATFPPATLGPTYTSSLQRNLLCSCLDLDFSRRLAETIGDMADLETVTLGRSRRSTAGNRYDRSGCLKNDGEADMSQHAGTAREGASRGRG